MCIFNNNDNIYKTRKHVIVAHFFQNGSIIGFVQFAGPIISDDSQSEASDRDALERLKTLDKDIEHNKNSDKVNQFEGNLGANVNVNSNSGEQEQKSNENYNENKSTKTDDAQAPVESTVKDRETSPPKSPGLVKPDHVRFKDSDTETIGTVESVEKVEVMSDPSDPSHRSEVTGDPSKASSTAMAPAGVASHAQVNKDSVIADTAPKTLVMDHSIDSSDISQDKFLSLRSETNHQSSTVSSAVVAVNDDDDDDFEIMDIDPKHMSRLNKPKKHSISPFKENVDTDKLVSSSKAKGTRKQKKKFSEKIAQVEERKEFDYTEEKTQGRSKKGQRGGKRNKQKIKNNLKNDVETCSEKADSNVEDDSLIVQNIEAHVGEKQKRMSTRKKAKKRVSHEYELAHVTNVSDIKGTSSDDKDESVVNIVNEAPVGKKLKHKLKSQSSEEKIVQNNEETVSTKTKKGANTSSEDIVPKKGRHKPKSKTQTEDLEIKTDSDTDNKSNVNVSFVTEIESEINSLPSVSRGGNRQRNSGNIQREMETPTSGVSFRSMPVINFLYNKNYYIYIISRG